jgi:hypothetical protein
VINIPTYLNFRVVVSDTMPVALSGPNLIYTTYLCAPGIIGFGESPPDMPVETKRTPEAGMGSGQETLFTRRQFALQPRGWDWTDAVVSGKFPNTAELQLAANWQRSLTERKMHKVAVLRTLNG